MCVRVYDIEFIVFTDCESWTRLITTNPVSMEAGEYGLTRETCFFARRLEVVAVAGLLWLSRCVFGEAGLFRCRPRVHNRWLRETQTVISVDNVKRLRQSANLPTENSRPPIPTRCTV